MRGRASTAAPSVAQVSGKADGSTFRGWLDHQLSNGIEYDLELPVVFALKRGELLRQDLVTREDRAKPRKGTHDFDIDAHCALAPQHTGKHCNAVLGEGVGCFRRPITPAGLEVSNL
jgi:hypothetical protein